MVESVEVGSSHRGRVALVDRVRMGFRGVGFGDRALEATEADVEAKRETLARFKARL
jgi:hypothetical protein